MSQPAFFPFPYPVVTPIRGADGEFLQGYAIYVTPSPLYENDAWAVQLDEGRILHFSTNQLRGVANGTYHINPPKPDAAPASGGLDLYQPPFAPNAPKPKPTPLERPARHDAAVEEWKKRAVDLAEEIRGARYICETYGLRPDDSLLGWLRHRLATHRTDAGGAGLVHCKSATRPGSTVCGIDRIDEKLVLITFNQALVNCAGCR